MDDDGLMTCARLVETLDDYLEGCGEAAARAAVEAHLAGCAPCAALAADVRALRTAARTLEPIEPPAYVWRRVQARLEMDAPRKTTLPGRLGLSGWRTFEPLGAVAALLLVIASLAWVGTRLTGTSPATNPAGAPAGFQLAEAEYADAIARLEEAAEEARPRLDALTSATLRASVDDVDLAIGDARTALAREPGDALSQENLLDALGSKVALLQDTVALVGDLEPGPEEQTP